MAAVFDSYWEGGDFRPFDHEEFAANIAVQPSGSTTILAPIELRLYPFQERLLEQVAVSRQRDRQANLLVAATGTGKTVMAAVDYARMAKKLERSRLLFVAHSKEILEQSLVTFRHALHDGDFGELWVGGETPNHWENVFASIQSLNASGLRNLEPDHFDVVIVDEFHHGAAKSYERFLNFVRPKQLLGLTATPERADGLDILKWFGGRIAAELRLWDAIDQGRLVPFDYYGVHDNSDLSGLTWKRGRGYDSDELTNVYTADDAWAKLVLAQLAKRVPDFQEMRALGFCVSIAHAQFMAKVFSVHGVSAKAIWGNTPAAERKAALRELRSGEVNILFTVDLFNEGVDIPNVDVLLFLRPTESPVLFLQRFDFDSEYQLGFQL
jgi:superfamily II DNA or RNA helicase